jgi:hypothetical protein
MGMSVKDVLTALIVLTVRVPSLTAAAAATPHLLPLLLLLLLLLALLQHAPTFL